VTGSGTSSPSMLTIAGAAEEQVCAVSISPEDRRLLARCARRPPGLGSDFLAYARRRAMHPHQRPVAIPRWLVRQPLPSSPAETAPPLQQPHRPPQDHHCRRCVHLTTRADGRVVCGQGIWTNPLLLTSLLTSARIRRISSACPSFSARPDASPPRHCRWCVHVVPAPSPDEDRAPRAIPPTPPRAQAPDSLPDLPHPTDIPVNHVAPSTAPRYICARGVWTTSLTAGSVRTAQRLKRLGALCPFFTPRPRAQGPAVTKRPTVVG
jgi:hypothetical protein